MAKQISSARSDRQTIKKQPWVARHQILTVLILAIAGFGIYAATYTVQHNRQIAAERKQFMQAKTDLDDLYAKLVAAVGEPVQHKALQYCSYTSVEIGQGERSCDVRRYFVYGPSKDVSETLQRANNVVEGSTRVIKFEPGVKGSNNTSSYQELELQSFHLDNLSCYVDYWKFTNSQSPLDTIKISGVTSGFLIDVSCGGSAKAEYFPELPD